MTALENNCAAKPNSDLIARQRQGWSLEGPFYTDPAIFDWDVEHVWQRQWVFVGHGSQLPTAGDYFLAELGAESLIITRDAKGEVHALLNSCRHRGSRVCLEPSGHARSLVCPYHQWVYGLDGRLLSARLMPESFDKPAFGLGRAQAHELEGLIFICLASEPPDFAAFARQIGPRLRHHALATARIACSHTYDIQANWKLVIENSRECYHCGEGHPQYCKAVGFAAAIGSRELQESDAALNAQREQLLAETGIELDPIRFEADRWFHFRRFFLREGMRTESMDGQPVAPLMGTIPNYETGVFAVVTLPNLLLEASPDYVMTLAVFPVSAQLTRAKVSWLVRGDAREGIDFEVPRLKEFWRITGEQDWKLCENNQSGVNSHFYQPGPYAPDERGVEHFVRWYLDKVKCRPEFGRFNMT